MKRVFLAFALLSLAMSPLFSQGVSSDSWAATDALGRKVRSYNDAPSKRDGKFVAMFFWTWHQGNDDTTPTLDEVGVNNALFPSFAGSTKTMNKYYRSSGSFYFIVNFGAVKGGVELSGISRLSE